MEFKPKLVRRGKKGHFILLQGTKNQQDITILNIYAPNNVASVYIKQTLLNFKNQINQNTLRVGNFNTPFSPLDRSSKQKLNKEIVGLNSRINGIDLMDIYRVFHPSSSEYTFFSAAHGSFSKTDHMLCHKEAINKYKEIELLPCVLSNHNGMQLEMNDKTKNKNYSYN